MLALDYWLTVLLPHHTHSVQKTEGVGVSGSWPALGEMAEKAKKDDNKNSSPADKQSPTSTSPTHPSQTQDASSLAEKGENEDGGIGEPSGEMSELEQQKLAAGKRKGTCVGNWCLMSLLPRVICKSKRTSLVISMSLSKQANSMLLSVSCLSLLYMEYMEKHVMWSTCTYSYLAVCFNLFLFVF